MPRYKVQTDDGRILTIEAENEQGVSQAMNAYMQNRQPPQPETGSFAQGALGAVPFGRAIAEGGYQGTGAQKAGQIAGDIGGASGLGALGVAAGAGPAALALGTAGLVGGAMEATGANQALSREAENIRQSGSVPAPRSWFDVIARPQKAAYDLITKGPGEYSYDPNPESQSVASNFLEMAKGEIPATGVELSPMAIAALTGLLGKAGFSRLGAQKAPKTAPEANTRAQFAQREGIPLTRGEVEGLGSTASRREAGLRKTPGGEGPAMKMQESQQRAIREALAKRAESLGDDTLASEIRSGQYTEGRQLAGVPQEAKAQRSKLGQAVGDAKKALAKEVPIRSNFAKELTGEIEGMIKKYKTAGPNSDRATARNLLNDYLEQAKSVKTMQGAMDFLSDFDSAIKSTMSKAGPDVKKVAFGGVRKKIMSVLDEAGEKLAPKEQAALKKAKAAFADMADESIKVGVKLEDYNPSALLKKITGGQKSLQTVEDFHKVFKKGSPERKNLQSSVMQDVIKRSTTKDGVSGNSIAKTISKYDQDTLKAVFKDNPQALEGLKKFAKDLGDIENQRTALGTVPSGNSQTAALLQLIKKASGNFTLGVGPAVMEAFTKYKAGKAFAPYTPKPKASTPLVDAARRASAKIGGTTGKTIPVASALTQKSYEQNK